MRFIKYLNLALIIGVLVLFSMSLEGCTDRPAPVEPGAQTSSEEQKKVDLYVQVMRSAYQEENGGDGFLAVKLDTLSGLSEAGKQQVLSELKAISPQVYDFDTVKMDQAKFKLDEQGNHQASINGTVLWVNVEEYNNRKAIITGVSWFGNLGAVFPKYEATYRDGEWQLKLISMGIS